MLLEVKGVNFNYSKKSQKALDDVSFSIEKGEIVGVVGVNGAGKSTLFKTITGLLAPQSGTILLNEKEIHSESIYFKKQIGYLPENNPLPLDLYVREYLDLLTKIYGLKKSRVEEVIEQTRIGDYSKKKIKLLSKGYRQRLGLARSIIHKPSLIILDEPLSGLDPKQIIEIRETIRLLQKESGILFSSHIISEVKELSQRYIAIENGEIIQQGISDSIENIEKIFL